MPVFKVTVLETRLVSIDRYVVAADEDQARQLAEENDWSNYNGLADGADDDTGSVLKREADDCEELTAADVRQLREDWEADWSILDHVEREQGPKLFFEAVPPGEMTEEEEAAQDKHLYGI